MKTHKDKKDEKLAEELSRLIAERTAAPDMALSGRMLEPDKEAKAVWKNLETNVEASLQVAHAISTHQALPMVDYYVAAHTVGAFIRSAACANPTGKQNSFAAHNPPDGILVEIKNTPISYANAFASPVSADVRDLVSQSVAQLGQYVHDIDEGYRKPENRFWFSPNLRHRLTVIEHDSLNHKETDLTQNNFRSLDKLINNVVGAIGYDWESVRQVRVNPELDS